DTDVNKYPATVLSFKNKSLYIIAVSTHLHSCQYESTGIMSLVHAISSSSVTKRVGVTCLVELEFTWRPEYGSGDNGHAWIQMCSTIGAMKKVSIVVMTMAVPKRTQKIHDGGVMRGYCDWDEHGTGPVPVPYRISGTDFFPSIKLLILKLTLPPILGLTMPGAWFSRDNAKYRSLVRVSTSTPIIVPADIEFRERRVVLDIH
ncbi:hypothetical protein Tco_0968751, partial [Tanacetum coccineum]